MNMKTYTRCCLIFLLCISPALQAANRVSNTVTGVVFTNLTTAIQALAQDNDTLLLEPGIYNEPELTIRSYAVTIQGSDAETVIIQPIATNRIAQINILEELGVTNPVVFKQLTLRNGNSTTDGGAIHVQEGRLTVQDCIITGNRSSVNGGALAAASSADAILIATNCIFSNNTAGKNGGAILRGTANNCRFDGNNAANGGASAYTTLNGCNISNNTATSQGGGSYNGTADRTTFRSNQAVFGGGAYETTVVNSLLIENTASQTGGGANKSTLINCTLIRNAAQTAGGGLHNGATTNSIFFENTAVTGADYESSTLRYSRAIPLAEGEGNITDVPFFRAAENGNYTLLSYSPCVDSGTNSASTGTDLNNNPRQQGTSVDMGAYEHDPAIIDLYGFQAWLERRGLSTDTDIQFKLDHNSNGIPNGLEFAYGENRINGKLLVMKNTDDGPVAETAIRALDSIGHITIDVITADDLAAGNWTTAETAPGAPDGAARYRRTDHTTAKQGYFRLRAALP